MLIAIKEKSSHLHIKLIKSCNSSAADAFITLLWVKKLQFSFSSFHECLATLALSWCCKEFIEEWARKSVKSCKYWLHQVNIMLHVWHQAKKRRFVKKMKVEIWRNLNLNFDYSRNLNFKFLIFLKIVTRLSSDRVQEVQDCQLLIHWYDSIWKMKKKNWRSV